MSKPKLGGIVLYRAGGVQRAAIVTRVNEDGSVNLHVFPNDHLDRQVGPVTLVKEGQEENQYALDETTPPVPPPPQKGKKSKEEEGE
jgi:hypothetical protein